MKWIVFPYTPKFLPVLKNISLLEDEEIICLSAPLGFSLEEKDGYIWGEKKSGYTVHEKIDAKTEALADGIWITPEIAYIPEQELENVLGKLPVNGKKIYDSSFSDDRHANILSGILKRMGAGEIIHRRAGAEEQEPFMENEELYKFKAPVVSVAGAGTYTQKFDMQLYLRRKFLKMGYQVSQVGTRTYCEMFGFHSMPSWMFDTTYTDYEKVFAFNHYLKTIEMEEKPEVIILGLPEGIMPFNKKHPQGFGLKAFEICAAVHPDYMLMNLYHGNYTEEFYEEMRNLLKYRVHTEIDDFYISDFVPVSTSFKREQLVFTHADQEDGSSFLMLEDTKLAERAIEKLSLYEEYEIL